jgi:hypothetical protein
MDTAGQDSWFESRSLRLTHSCRMASARGSVSIGTPNAFATVGGDVTVGRPDPDLPPIWCASKRTRGGAPGQSRTHAGGDGRKNERCPSQGAAAVQNFIARIFGLFLPCYPCVRVPPFPA